MQGSGQRAQQRAVRLVSEHPQRQVRACLWVLAICFPLRSTRISRRQHALSTSEPPRRPASETKIEGEGARAGKRRVERAPHQRKALCVLAVQQRLEGALRTTCLRLQRGICPHHVGQLIRLQRVRLPRDG